jgi:RNA polymerase sigma-B factor
LLSGQPGTALLADLLGEDDPQMDHMLDMRAVAKQRGELSPHEQKILLMRFYDGMTQDEIGQQLDISQMQVSGCSAVRSVTSRRLSGSDEATLR